MPVRLFLLDPGLVSVHGHHASYDRAVCTGAHALGIETQVFCNRHADEAALAGLSAARVFSYSPYVLPALAAQVTAETLVAALRPKTDMFLKELGDAVTPRVGPDDVVYAHTVFIPELEALVRWYRDLPPARRPRLAVMLRFEPEAGFVLFEVPETSTAAHRELVQELEQLAPPERLAIVTDTPMLTAAYQSIAGSQRVRTLPIPIVPRPRPVPGIARCTISYVGEASPDKGFYIALEATRLLAGQRPDIRFRFQSGRTTVSPEVQAGYPNVEFLPGGLSDADYFALIDSSIAVLALYNPASYRRRSSGVFTDAVIRGTMPISSRCAAAAYIEEMDCPFLIARDWTAEAAAEKIIEVYDRREKYGVRFQAASARFADYHRADRFMTELLACLGVYR